MADSRPAVPAEVARTVRKRCGFGCVFCGCPVFELHHIEAWAESKEHRAEDLTLLCGSCHAKEQKGLISKERVRAADTSPVNIATGTTASTELLFEGAKSIFVLGTVELQNSSETSFFSALQMDGFTVLGFRFDEGHLLLNVLLLNQYNEPVMVVDDGFLQLSTEPWDIRWEGKTITIREGRGEIRLQISFQPPDKVTIARGFFLLNGLAIQISDKGLECLNTKNKFDKCTFAANGFGMAFGPVCTPPGAYWEVRANRYKWLLPQWEAEERWNTDQLGLKKP